MDRLDEVTARLAELQREDPKFKIFGAGSHRYRLNPPYPEAELVTFERSHGIELPAEYRAFITKLGNGGAGPSYGVMPFRGKDPEDYTKYELLATPFPYDELYNPDELLSTDDDDDESDDEDDDDPQHRYWGAFSQEGMLYICHHGCASRSMLVVSGACRGEVWWDETANDAGYGPSMNQGTRLGFYDWYLDWVERSLVELLAHR